VLDVTAGQFPIAVRETCSFAATSELDEAVDFVQVRIVDIVQDNASLSRDNSY
jgi:hypothetical protein